MSNPYNNQPNSRSQRPISPEQLFQRLMVSNYKQIQCQDQSLKLRQQRQVLLQLIVQYQKSIQSQLIKIRQQSEISKLRQQRIYQLERLKCQRNIIQEEIQNQMNRLRIKKEENQEKIQLTIELTQIRQVNSKIKFKIRDLRDYVNKLEIYNKKLEAQRNVLQANNINRMRINEEGWKQKINVLKMNHEIYENQLKAKIIQKESINIQNIRRSQQQINQRNRKRWDSFKQSAFSTNPLPLPVRSVSKYSSRIPQRSFQRFRVI